MPLVRFPLALLSVWCVLGAEKPVPRVAPIYDAASIVNAADNQSGALAPNTLGTIYGANLAYSIAAITLNDIQGGVLPTVLGTSETRFSSTTIPPTCITSLPRRSTSWFPRIMLRSRRWST